MKFLSTKTKNVNWWSGAVKLDPDSLQESFELWKATDDNYVIITYLEGSASVLPLYFGKSGSCHIEEDGYIRFPVPNYLDTTEVGRSDYSLYVTSASVGDLVALLTEIRKRAVKESVTPWFAPAGLRRGKLMGVKEAN